MLFISFSSQILAEVSLCCLRVRSWLDLLAASCFPFCSILFPPPAIFLLHGFSAPGRLSARQRSRFFLRRIFRSAGSLSRLRKLLRFPLSTWQFPAREPKRAGTAVSRSRAGFLPPGLQPDFSSSRTKRVGDVPR
jgi:hypothetical protein